MNESTAGVTIHAHVITPQVHVKHAQSRYLHEPLPQFLIKKVNSLLFNLIIEEYQGSRKMWTKKNYKKGEKHKLNSVKNFVKI